MHAVITKPEQKNTSLKMKTILGVIRCNSTIPLYRLDNIDNSLLGDISIPVIKGEHILVEILEGNLTKIIIASEGSVREFMYSDRDTAAKYKERILRSGEAVVADGEFKNSDDCLSRVTIDVQTLHSYLVIKDVTIELADYPVLYS
ncbi:hypothetical protein [Clostridium tertium]|uniref:hypothetical protein n=1 Tax=Clostridium tertium TaxID=1559 RepID=UPI0023B325D9|nr:hypothetical protein [Clostridium tertium]